MATKKKIAEVKVEPITKEAAQPVIEPIVETKIVEAKNTATPIASIEPIATVVEKPTIIEEIKAEVVQPVIVSQEESDLTIEEKILNFVKSRDGEIKLNPFIKSLYPKQAFNEPEIYLRQGESKAIRHTLQKLIDRNEFQVKGNTHKLLGSFYYNDTDQKTKYHNINNIEIIVEK